MVNRQESDGRLRSGEERSQSPFSIDGCPENSAAAGYRNGESLNNAGQNGNYWSSTPNADDTQNAVNLNFNSNDRNTNWNNRRNGQTVRPVSELTEESLRPTGSRHFRISREQLLVDLYRAYKDARRHKRGRGYQLEFEYRLEDNLVALRDELYDRTYKPEASTCFIIHDPKMREVFAAAFRDRIVHHLFYNYTHVLFERTFIQDSYSCIRGRGTHYGIERLRHHIRSVSAGYSRPCYVLKIDVRAYFMSIDRKRLLGLCRRTMDRMRGHESDVEGQRWEERIDYELVDYLLETIVESDPTVDCRRVGRMEEWAELPAEKSLFNSREDCGLAIGNLSSQLFSNVYLNELDQYAKRRLGCRHYGRYVDDAYVVSSDRRRLRELIGGIRVFLRDELGLELSEGKTRIYDAGEGVEFLGAYLRPFRTYVASGTLRRMRRKMLGLRMGSFEERSHARAALASWRGVVSHYRSYCLWRVVRGRNDEL